MLFLPAKHNIVTEREYKLQECRGKPSVYRNNMVLNVWIHTLSHWQKNDVLSVFRIPKNFRLDLRYTIFFYNNFLQIVDSLMVYTSFS